MNELKQAILRTIIYFDIFEYPLTLVEIWKWLNTDYTDDSRINTDDPQIGTDGSQMTHRLLADIEVALGQMSDKVENKNGFYFLTGRQHIVEKRLKRYSIAEDKFKRAIKYVKFLGCIPFIKMIAVCNTLAYSNSSKSSDIDLFIVTQKNRLWLTRFLTVGFLKWLGVRPSADTKEDAIDATFFLAEDELKIENLKLKTHEDIYLTHWVDQIVPVYNVDDTYKKFQSANKWIKETLPNSIGYQLNQRRQVSSNFVSNIIHLILVFLIDWQVFEKLSKKYQLEIMPQVLKDMMNKDTRVVVNDKVLKFHRDDRREEYQEKFGEKCEILR